MAKLTSCKITMISCSQRDLMTVFNEMDECLTDMGILQVNTCVCSVCNFFDIGE